MKKLILFLSFVLCAFSQEMSDEDLNSLINSPLMIECVQNNNCNKLQEATKNAGVDLKIMLNDIAYGLYLKERYKEAFQYLNKACELNDGMSCGFLGRLYKDGLGVRQNASEAFKYAKKSCDLNIANACHDISLYYRQSFSVKQSYSEALKYSKKACDLNYVGGCFDLAISYINGKGVKQNLKQAKEYFGKACDLGDQEGCDEYRKLNEKGY